MAMNDDDPATIRPSSYQLSLLLFCCDPYPYIYIYIHVYIYPYPDHYSILLLLYSQ